jgi:hypothetical protein
MKNIKIILAILSIAITVAYWKYINMCPKYMKKIYYIEADEATYEITDSFVVSKLFILDNPFNATIDNSIIEIYFNHKLIYRNSYKDTILLAIPTKLLEEGIMPAIAIQKDKCGFGDTFKGDSFILYKGCLEKGLAVTLSPERGANGSLFVYCVDRKYDIFKQ